MRVKVSNAQVGPSCCGIPYRMFRFVESMCSYLFQAHVFSKARSKLCITFLATLATVGFRMPIIWAKI